MVHTEMAWSLEVVLVPVSDIDRAKAFYRDQLGFRVDYDLRIGGDTRWVQLTPPGSGCSIAIGKGMTSSGEAFAQEPGSMQGLQLVVNDVRAARDELLRRGVTVSEVQVVGDDGPAPAPDDAALDNVAFVHFTDPDGNGWAVQQITSP